MSASQHRLDREELTPRRIVLLVGVLLAGLILACATATNASAFGEQVGVYVAGEEAEEAENGPKLEAESYPVDLVGTSDTAHEFGFGEIASLECPWAEFVDGYGTGGATAATSELPLWTFYPYFACQWSTGGSLTISANGCEDIVTIDNAGPPYVGKFGMECPEGWSYELHHEGLGLNCTAAIPAQSGLSTVSYENVGEGSEQAVQVEFDVSGMDYSITGGGACPVGEYENGTYTGTMTLRGYEIE